MNKAPMNRWGDSLVDKHPERHKEQLAPPIVELDLTPYKEVRVRCGEQFVITTPEHLVECLSWLLTNVDTGTVIDRDGVWPDE